LAKKYKRFQIIYSDEWFVTTRSKAIPSRTEHRTPNTEHSGYNLAGEAEELKFCETGDLVSAENYRYFRQRAFVP
jgi:hypothetical protein